MSGESEYVPGLIRSPSKPVRTAPKWRSKMAWPGRTRDERRHDIFLTRGGALIASPP